MEIEKKFFVYVDFRGDDRKPFYVGKGITKRIKNLERNPLHTNIKKKHGIIREVVFETHSEQESFEKEIQLIQELQTHIDHGNGGANLTLGGDGTSGYKFTIEQKEKMGESLKKLCEDPEQRKKISESVKKQWENSEHKKKMSETSKKMWENPEHRKKISESVKKQWENPEHREKMSESSKKIWEDPECREKISESSKKMWEDPVFKEKMSESHKKKWENPEYKEKISKSQKKLWEDPEYRAKVLEKQRIGKEKKKLEKLQQEV